MAGLLLAIVGRDIPNGESNSVLQALRQASQEIAPFVENAEQRQLNDESQRLVEQQQRNDEYQPWKTPQYTPAGKWLTGVKNIYYELIDVIDERRVANLGGEKKGLLSCLKPVRKRPHNNNTKIQFLIQGVENHRLASVNFGVGGTSNSKRECELGSQSKSLADEAKTFGREHNLETLMSKLLESTERASIYYVAIKGMGGVGKTTLAQLVYGSVEKMNHFHIKAWVSVSYKFSQTKILKKIIESVTNNSYPTDEVELDILIQQFRQTIGGKKFIFVLDDVWEESYSEWELVKYAFEAGAPGSVVLATTRSEKVALIAGSTYTMPLQGLSEDDSWTLLSYLAFDGQTLQTEINDFAEIGRQIAIRCQGLPLALRALGGLLRTKTSVEDWRRVLMEFEKFSGSGIMPTFMLSYCDLDPLLRQCLLYCSVFPKDHSINVDKLIKLWMAQDYFDEAKSQDMETQGRYCFEELLSRSFFENLRKDDHGNSVSKMHKLLTEFIQLLVRGECCRRKDFSYWSEVEVRQCRHWTLRNYREDLMLLGVNLENSHTIIIIEENPYADPRDLPYLLPRFKRLRALGLSHFLIKELPIKIGDSLHLRYLDFSFNRDLKELPEALCDLFMLQTLNLNGCDSLQKLPDGMGKLIRLRHLEILWTISLSYLPKGIGRLTSLRTLSRFIGTGDVYGKACNLGDLEKLSNLQGYITIDGLGSVKNMALAQKASLKSKQLVHDLELCFSGARSHSKDVAVLEVLQPPPNLRRLGLFLYRGISFPDWMATMMQLRHLMLSACSGCEILPPLAKLPSLETLELRSLINLKKVGPKFLGMESDRGDGGQIVSTKTDDGDGGMEVTSTIRAAGGGIHGKEIISDINDGDENIMSTTRSTSSNGAEEVTSAMKAAARTNRGKEIIRDISDAGERAMSSTGSTSGNGGKEETPGIRAVGGRSCGEGIIPDISDGGESATGSAGRDGGNVVFPKLKKLGFHDLTNWEEWAEINGSEENVTIMPNLFSLTIVKCPRIKAVPAYIRMKETLSRHIEECPLLNLNDENPVEKSR